MKPKPPECSWRKCRRKATVMVDGVAPSCFKHLGHVISRLGKRHNLHSFQAVLIKRSK